MISANDAIRLKAVNHVTYNCTDKDRALRFWEDVLGIKQIPKQVNGEHQKRQARQSELRC